MSPTPTPIGGPTAPIDPQNSFARIKGTDYATAPLTLWIVYKRYSAGKNAKDSAPAGENAESQGPAPAEVDGAQDPAFESRIHFSVRLLKTDKILGQKLAGVVQDQIQPIQQVVPYLGNELVTGNSALSQEISETAFDMIREAIVSAGPKEVVTCLKDLHAAYGYVIHLQPARGPALMAFRRVQAGWKAKLVVGLINALFKGNVLVTADGSPLFRFEPTIDFFADQNFLFILDEAGFESALNFRVRMEKKCNDLMAGLEQTGLYDNLDLIRGLSGKHVRWLKKLAGAQYLGKCLQPAWVQKLVACCQEKGLPVTGVGGRVQITKENCELVVRLMNYDVLESPIDHILFEIEGTKHPLRSASTGAGRSAGLARRGPAAPMGARRSSGGARGIRRQRIP